MSTVNAEELRPRTEAGRRAMRSFPFGDTPLGRDYWLRKVIEIEDEARSNQLQVIERERLARALDWIGAPELDYHVSEMNAGNGSDILAGVILQALSALDSTTGDERG